MLQTHSYPARLIAVGRIHKCLNFNQQGTTPFTGNEYGSPRCGFTMGCKEDGRRVIDLAQAFIGHGKNTKFVDGAIAVLDGTNHPITTVTVSLEIQHSINYVLQYPGPRQ